MQRYLMVSSTARDLPRHRDQVLHACLSLPTPWVPRMMEHLPASTADAVSVSTAMVDACQLYVGVFGQRYGHVPAGSEISVTEMEYRRACERGVPRLIFLMADDHPLTAADVETGPGAERLQALRKRLTELDGNIVKFFSSPAQLGQQLMQSLVAFDAQTATNSAPALAGQADLSISSLGSQWRTRPLHGHPVLQRPDFGGAVYTGGARISFTLAHNGAGPQAIHLHALVPEILAFRAGPVAELNFQLDGDQLLGAGVRSPRVFALSVVEGVVRAARWMPESPGQKPSAALSENLLDTDPPRVLHFDAAQDNIEELQGSITLRGAGLVRLRFAFHYSVGGKDHSHFSEPLALYQGS